MFDKSKERIAKLEETNETFRTVKAHLTKYQMQYVVVGASAATMLVTKSLITKPQVIAPVVNNTVAPIIAPVFNNTVNNGSYARKIVRCVETDQMWPSMSKAAESAGHTLQAMSKHIHGQNEHLDGLHYVIEGLAAN